MSRDAWFYLPSYSPGYSWHSYLVSQVMYSCCRHDLQSHEAPAPEGWDVNVPIAVHRHNFARLGYHMQISSLQALLVAIRQLDLSHHIQRDLLEMHIVQSAYRIGCFLIDMLTGLGSCGISDLAARTHSSIQQQSRWHRVHRWIGREILRPTQRRPKIVEDKL